MAGVPHEAVRVEAALAMRIDKLETSVTALILEGIMWVPFAEQTEVMAVSAVTIGSLDIILSLNISKRQRGARNHFKLVDAIFIHDRLSEMSTKDSKEKSGQAKGLEKIHCELKLDLN